MRMIIAKILFSMAGVWGLETYKEVSGTNRVD
jgi:hypothetical protein